MVPGRLCDRLKFPVSAPIRDRDPLRLALNRRQAWGGEAKLKAQDQSANGSEPGLVVSRHEPRFKLEVEISIRTRSCGVLAGHTVDISESGISAMLKIEVPLSEIVELGFVLPIGHVNISAMVRQRDAFRYGFQFIGSDAAQDVIRSTCRQLAVEQRLLREPAVPSDQTS
jgi:hypothetical protein